MTNVLAVQQSTSAGSPFCIFFLHKIVVFPVLTMFLSAPSDNVFMYVCMYYVKMYLFGLIYIKPNNIWLILSTHICC